MHKDDITSQMLEQVQFKPLQPHHSTQGKADYNFPECLLQKQIQIPSLEKVK